MIELLSVVSWVLTGFLASGFFFATVQRGFEFLRKRDFQVDQIKAAFLILFGPISLFALVLVLLATSTFNGWLNPFGNKAKREAGIV
jgi:nitric oxide reductase large subunit